jgi:DNA-directed RNA polymerase subunit RPC12/RpoP
MNMKARKPLPGPPKAQVQVDLRKAETIKCKKCSNYVFIQSFILKRLSAILSPTGEEALIPVQVYSCGNCGEVAENMLEGAGIEEEKKSDGFPMLDV